MLDRVHHTNRRYSKWYIEKGIKVCPEWEEWLNFKAWSLANGYDDSLTLDRINSDGNYCPENCRWATRKEQNNNKSDNVVIEFEGVKKTATQWGESIGATGAVVKRRLDHGWTIDEAVKTPNGTTRGWRERIQK